MSYQKQNFANGEVLSASQLNHIEDGIADVESAANATKTVVDNIIDPTLSLSGKAADAAKVGEAVNAESERAKGVESQIKEDLGKFVGIEQSDLNGLIIKENDILCSADELLRNGYIDNNNGEVVENKSWLYSPYIVISSSAEYVCIMCDDSTGTLSSQKDIYYAFFDKFQKFTHGGVTSPENKILSPKDGDSYLRVSASNDKINSYGIFMLVDITNAQKYFDSGAESYEKNEKSIKYQSKNVVTFDKNAVNVEKIELGKYRNVNTIVNNDDYCYVTLKFREVGIYKIYDDNGNEITCTYISSAPYDDSGNQVAKENEKLSATFVVRPYTNISFYLTLLISDFQKGLHISLSKNLDTLSEYIGETKIGVRNETLNLNKSKVVNITNPVIDLSNRGYVYIRFDSLIYAADSCIREYKYKNLKSDFPNDIYLSDDWTDGSIYLSFDFSESKKQKYYVLNPIRHKSMMVSELSSTDIILLSFANNDFTRPFGVLWNEFILYDYYRRNTIRSGLTKDMLAKVGEKEDEIIKNINSDSFVFSYSSDDHQQEYFSNSHGITYECKQDYTNMAIDLVDHHIDFDAIVNSGDSVLTTTRPMESLKYVLNLVDTKKLIYVQGNHDRNIDPDSGIISQKDFFALMYHRFRNDSTYSWGNPYKASYFYKDFKGQKIRIVVLDLYNLPEKHDSVYNDNGGYRQDQLQWLANNALKVDSGWTAIICTHVAPVPMTYSNNTVNMGLLHKLLKAYMNGESVKLYAEDTTFNDGTFSVDFTADFTDQGQRDLAAVLAGHNHWDEIRNVDGINYVTICCGYLDINMYKPSGQFWDNGNQRNERYKDDYSNIAFDVCVLDTQKRTLKFFRIGYGNDRNITY